MSIENVGTTDVINPWLVANVRRDWSSIDSIAREICQLAGGAKATETELARALWKFGAEEIYDQRAGLACYDSAADLVRLLNVYGL